MTNPEDVRARFSVYARIPDLAYFDSASTTLVPDKAVQASADFTKNIAVSSRKGAHRLAVEGANAVEEARKSMAHYLDSPPQCVSFQKSLSSAVASLAYGYDWSSQRRNEMVISAGEENSVFAPLLRCAEVLGLEVKSVPVDSGGTLNMSILDSIVSDRTGIVAVGHVSPGTGNTNPVSAVSEIAHEAGAVLVTDVTRSVGVKDTSLTSLGSDVPLFSANIGLMGPPGLTVQWTSPTLDEIHTPGILGGSSVSNVDTNGYDLALSPDKYESGMLNVPAIVGLRASLEFIEGIPGYYSHLRKLSQHLNRRLRDVQGLRIYGSPDESNTIFGFNLESDGDIGCHDVALFLNESNIAVRSGLICAHPLVESMAGGGLVQASIHVYNTVADIDRLCDTLSIIVRDCL